MSPTLSTCASTPRQAGAREPVQELELLLDLGEAMLACGAGSLDVETALRRCALALGLTRHEVSITYTEVQIAVAGPYDDARPFTAMRIVRTRATNHVRLTRLHRLAGRLAEGALPCATAAEELRHILRAREPYPAWFVSLAWGVLGAAVAAQLGGRLLLVSVTFVTALMIAALSRLLAARAVPPFYLNVFGGFLVTMVAAVLVELDAPVRPPLVIAAGVVVLLPGLVLITSVQDALTGFMVTAAGRTVEVLLLGAGIVSGVAFGLILSRELGIVMPVIDPLALDLAGLPARFVSAGLVAATVAIMLGTPRPVLVPVFLLGGAGYLGFLALHEALESPALSRAIAAGALGLLGQAYANRRGFPALVLAVPLITPMLPGLAIYSAMLQLSQGDELLGVAALMNTVAQALALAAGVLFGQFLGQSRRTSPTRTTTGLFHTPSAVAIWRARSTPGR